MRKQFNTNGTILIDKESNAEVIQLQGDVRKAAFDFLVTYKVCEKEEIKVHGA
jgi:translation initiation factor SUI1